VFRNSESVRRLSKAHFFGNHAMAVDPFKRRGYSILLKG
jgi:hypothetical protein